MRRFLRSAPIVAASAAATAAVWAATFGAQALAQSQADPEAATGFEPKPAIEATEMMIVTAHPLASEAGFRVLASGGSAVDAGIAAQLALNVVEPQSSGIGGGGFALYWDNEAKTLEAWDGREFAPLGAEPDMFLDETGAPLKFLTAVAGGTSVGAPGLPRLMEAMHAKHGALPWEGLFSDAILLAEDGFDVSPRLSQLLAVNALRLIGNEDFRAVYFSESGLPYREGARLRNPQLAATFRAMAENGADAFYKGPIAEAIIASVGAEPRPSAMTLDDLAAYEATERAPVCMTYRAVYLVCGMGPPSSGATTVGHILGLLDAFDLSETGPNDPQAAHLFLEASRLAYADRAKYLGDPDVVKVPAKGLLDPDYLATRAALIPEERASVGEAEAGTPPWEEGRLDFAPDRNPGAPGTTHLTVVDAKGDILSMTSSIEIGFGSGRMAAGFLLNNQLTDFSFLPEEDGKPVANAVGPRKRPRSSMAPTIVFDISGGGMRPILALGSPGGSRIIEYVARALVAQLDQGAGPAEAAALPHLSHRNSRAQIEGRPDADALVEALTARGHEITRAAMTSGLHIIAIGEDGMMTSGVDPRREGLALGR